MKITLSQLRQVIKEVTDTVEIEQDFPGPHNAYYEPEETVYPKVTTNPKIEKFAKITNDLKEKFANDWWDEDKQKYVPTELGGTGFGIVPTEELINSGIPEAPSSLGRIVKYMFAYDDLCAYTKNNGVGWYWDGDDWAELL